MRKIITIVILAALVLAAFSMLSGQSVRADASEARALSYSWYVAPSSTVLAADVGDLITIKPETLCTLKKFLGINLEQYDALYTAHKLQR